MVRVIAEAGTCANSIPWAHEAVEAAADAGAWGFKVQLLDADHIAAPDSPRYDRLPGPDTQYEAFAGALPYSAWAEVFDHAWDQGLEPFASCWDEAAVEACEAMGVRFYKVGSADITHHRLLRVIAQTGKPVFLSTGASTVDEILDAAEILGDVLPMACTLSYPCEIADARLERIGWLHDLGFKQVGYSDHTTGVATGGYAVAAGAEFLEKHFTVTPGRGGDHDFALDPAGLEVYRQHAEQAWRMTHHRTPVGEPLPSEEAARELARRSLHSTTWVREGDRVRVGVNARFVRPAGGLDARAVGVWVAARDIAPNTQIGVDDIVWS